MNEIKVREGFVRFEIGEDTFCAEFIYPTEIPGLVENEGTWRLSKFVYHSDTPLRPLKVRRGMQRPRLKTIGYFGNLEECRERLRGEEDEANTS